MSTMLIRCGSSASTSRIGKQHQMDNRFSFLSKSDSAWLNSVLARRNSALASRISDSHHISRTDASEIVLALADELADHLNDDWEPTEQGRRVSEILALVNARRLVEWPQ